MANAAKSRGDAYLAFLDQDRLHALLDELQGSAGRPGPPTTANTATPTESPEQASAA